MSPELSVVIAQVLDGSLPVSRALAKLHSAEDKRALMKIVQNKQLTGHTLRTDRARKGWSVGGQDSETRDPDAYEPTRTQQTKRPTGKYNEPLEDKSMPDYLKMLKALVSKGGDNADTSNPYKPPIIVKTPPTPRPMGGMDVVEDDTGSIAQGAHTITHGSADAQKPSLGKGPPFTPVTDVQVPSPSTGTRSTSRAHAARVLNSARDIATQMAAPPRNSTATVPVQSMDTIQQRPAPTVSLKRSLQALADNIGLSKAQSDDAYDHDSDNLHLFAENNGETYRVAHTPIARALRNRMANGSYDHSKAAKAWQPWVDHAFQEYKRQVGESPSGKGSHAFSADTRRKVAKEKADSFHHDAMAGHYDHLLRQKNKHKKIGAADPFEDQVEMELRHPVAERKYYRQDEPEIQKSFATWESAMNQKLGRRSPIRPTDPAHVFSSEFGVQSPSPSQDTQKSIDARIEKVRHERRMAGVNWHTEEHLK